MPSNPSMHFVRVTYLVPQPGPREAAQRLLTEIADALSRCDGFLGGYVIASSEVDVTSGLGRVGAWESKQAADRAAQLPHLLALRSELLASAAGGRHVELAFYAATVPAPEGMPALLGAA